MKSLYLISKYCTQANETNAFRVLFTYEHCHWSWISRVHFPDMPDLIIKGITSTSFGQQGSKHTCLPKWSNIHVPPTSSSPSHQSGVRRRSPWEHCRHSLHESQHSPRAGHLHWRFLTRARLLCASCVIWTLTYCHGKGIGQKLFVTVWSVEITRLCFSLSMWGWNRHG